MLALFLAALLQVSPAPLRPPPSPTVASGTDALLECDQDDDDALFPSPLDHGCPGTSLTASELTLAFDEDEYRSLAAEDPEAAWDRAFDDERESLDEGWRWGEE